MESVSGACEEVRLSLGAYVLEALDPEDGRRVGEHLAGCAACREEAGTLAAVTRALGRVSVAEVLQGAPEAAPPPLLERVAAEVARRRRRLRLRQRLAASVAALSLAGAGVAVGFLVAGRSGAAPVTAHLEATDSATGVVAAADVYRESWGSSIHMTISGVSPGQTCELTAVGWSGGDEVAGSWHVGYSGQATIDGAVAMDPEQVASLRVMTASGEMLVSLPMPSASPS